MIFASLFSNEEKPNCPVRVNGAARRASPIHLLVLLPEGGVGHRRISAEGVIFVAGLHGDAVLATELERALRVEIARLLGDIANGIAAVICVVLLCHSGPPIPSAIAASATVP